MQVHVTRGGTQAAGFEAAIAPVPEALRPYVEAWCGYREWSSTRFTRTESPTGRAVLIFGFGAALDVGRPGAAPTRHLGGFFAALDDGPSVTSFDAPQAGLQLTLSPRGAHALLGHAAGALARQVVGLEDLRIDEVSELQDAVSWGQRFELVQRFLLKRLARHRELSSVVRWALERIDASRGAVGIEALSAELGFSRKYLHRRFANELGLGPKRYAALRRFEHVVSRLRAGEVHSMARLAAEAGYADQAHLAREVRRFSGLSSTGLARGFDDPLSRALTS